MTTITIELTAEETERLLERAQAQGYEALDAYVHDLVAAEANDDDESLDDPVESFRIAWGEAMRDETMSEEEFWEAMNTDE